MRTFAVPFPDMWMARRANRADFVEMRIRCMAKGALGEIDSDGDNFHDCRVRRNLVNGSSSPAWHFDAVNRESRDMRLARDGVAPFIR